MFTERTSVGLDVHARSVAAAAIDGHGRVLPGETEPVATASPLGHHARQAQETRRGERRERARVGRLVLVLGRPRGMTRHPDLPRRPRPLAAARGATRETAMSKAERSARRTGTRDPLQPNRPSRGNQPAHISLTVRRQRQAGPSLHLRRRIWGACPHHGDGRLILTLTGNPTTSADFTGWPCRPMFDLVPGHAGSQAGCPPIARR